MKYIMIWLIRLYRRVISPLKPPCCRFSPTCSAYAIEAFQKRGFFVGMVLSIRRILRCNPFSRPGYDPVPAKGESWKRVPLRSKESLTVTCVDTQEDLSSAPTSERESKADNNEHEVN